MSTAVPRVLVAMDSFKGTATAARACAAMAEGIARVRPHFSILQLPLADGGAGTLDAVLRACGGERRTVMAAGPLGEEVPAEWGLLPGGATAVVEMAAASGLALVPAGRRDPLRSSSFGTGRVIRAALDAGARHLLLGIGDTATVDGGLGAAQALGARFFDASGRELSTPVEGGNLREIARVDDSALRSLLEGVDVEVLCDVSNPLLGQSGAARVFGPQKGACPEDVELLEAGLAHAFGVIEAVRGCRVRDLPGAGAAGGMGAGAVALLGARLVPGTDRLFALLGFDKALESADVLVTGEGRIDPQSLAGKGAGRAMLAARDLGKPVWAVSGLAPAGLDPAADLGIRRLAVLAPGGEPLGTEETLEKLAGIAAGWARCGESQ